MCVAHSLQESVRGSSLLLLEAIIFYIWGQAHDKDDEFVEHKLYGILPSGAEK